MDDIYMPLSIKDSRRAAESISSALRQRLLQSGIAPPELCQTAALVLFGEERYSEGSLLTHYHWQLRATIPDDEALDWAAIRALLDQHVTSLIDEAIEEDARARVPGEAVLKKLRGDSEPQLQTPSAAIPGWAGEYVVGPGQGSLTIRTGREGAAARAGHNLVLEVTSWSSTVGIGNSLSISLTADPESINVKSATGGQKALTERDYREIEKAITNKVLGRAPITFTSSAVRVNGNRMAVTGTLSIAGRSNTVAIDLQRSDSGAVQGSVTISQRSFGIRPFKALMGALKVSDDVVIDIQATLPVG